MSGRTEVKLGPEERAAARAYLQRSEVRLSTIHRVATALLSGAGIMVLLPIVGRDAVVDVLRHLFTGSVDASSVLLGISVVVALSIPLMSLMMVLRDLTEFYFHANHIAHAGGDTFAPRFTLTALRIPGDELGAAANAQLAERRSSAQAVELLIPHNDVARARFDARIAAYGGLGVPRRGDLGRIGPGDDLTAADRDGALSDHSTSHGDVPHRASEGDLARAEAMFVLADSQDRTLLEEVAKVEHGMVRHILRVQVIVLRYVKALLALLTTALAVFAAAAVVEGKAVLGAGDEAWLSAILMAWTPLAIVVVSTPVRWLDRLLRNEGATVSAVGDDPALTQVEDGTVRLALVGYLAAAAAMTLSLAHHSTTTEGSIFGAGVIVLTLGAVVFALKLWSVGPVWKRVTARS